MAKLTQYLVIHCTATPEFMPVSAKQIKMWHTMPAPAGRGWKQVGYTDMVHLDGRIERLVENNDDAFVDGWEVTNGVANMNSICRHIVYVGGLSSDGKTAKDTRTLKQTEALAKFVTDYHTKHQNVKIVGHNFFAKKACPSFDVQKWLKTIGL